MSRRRCAKKREILPDPKFKSLVLSKFVNVIMERGKKSVAESIVYGALENVENKGHKDPLKVFEQALENIVPTIELKSRRIGGANYQIPVEVSASRKTALAMRWLRDFSRKRNERSMPNRLANEIIDALDNRGGAYKKREEVHKMAEANKAFAHFRF